MKSVLSASVFAVCSGHDVHPERLAEIEAIQNTPGVLWQAAAHPRFATQAPGASSDMLGLKEDWKQDLADKIAKGEIVEEEEDEDLSSEKIPESFDSAQNWPECAKTIGDIRDQSNCGCCWAFAAAAGASDRMCINSKGSMIVPLSAQDVCFNSNKDGCNGGYSTVAWEYIQKGVVSGGQYKGTGPFGKGFCSDFSLPHCHHHGPQRDDPYPAEGAKGCSHQSSPKGPTKCDADAKAPHSDFNADKYSFRGKVITAKGERDMQRAVMGGGPMSVGLMVWSDFENYAGGIYHQVTGRKLGYHLVKLVGWGVEKNISYWKIANSWNPYWGEKGHFRIRRGTNEVTVESVAVASSRHAKWIPGSEGNATAATVIV